MNLTFGKSSISGLTLRLSVVGLPSHLINPFAGLLLRWSQCSGEEWTVKRVKTLKQYIISQFSGSDVDYPFAKNRKHQPKGIIGSIVRWALKDENNLSKAINACMAYTHWTSRLLTKAQKDKFLTAINAQEVEIPLTLGNALARTTRTTIGHRTIHESPGMLLTYQGSPSKRAPSIIGSVPQSDKILCEILLTMNDATWLHIKDLYEPIYRHVFEGIDIHKYVDDTHEDSIDYGPMIAGEVHFLQEPGYKLRSIASPYRLFQVASEPLKNALKSLIIQLPWDCTHDQSRAIPEIRRKLAAKQKVYSVDLSNATDYFPFRLQKIVLQTIFGVECHYIKLFEQIARAYWRSNIGMLKWNKGQPLGFNPSFFSFTLTHGLLLLTLLGKQWDHEFYVVGDDVVILDGDLYTKYKSCLATLGCPYSPDKTLTSNKLAEFAGKVILKDYTIPQLKWRSVSDENFIDLARVIGPRIRLLLTSKQKKILDIFAHVSDLVHPYGLNWSYKGSNLYEMVKRGLELRFEETVLASLTGLSMHMNRQLYADYSFHTVDLRRYVLTDTVSLVTRTFDEKVQSVFRSLGYARFGNEYFLEGLKDIPATLSRLRKEPMELPHEVRLPGRVTLLQRLIGFLKNH